MSDEGFTQSGDVPVAVVERKNLFVYEPMPSLADVRAAIRGCEGRHVQQIAYSSFMDTLTQVCFTCQRIRSTIAWSGNRSWNLETRKGGTNG